MQDFTELLRECFNILSPICVQLMWWASCITSGSRSRQLGVTTRPLSRTGFVGSLAVTQTACCCTSQHLRLGPPTSATSLCREEAALATIR